jgi:predicted RNA-binding Zn-ribbon protein involved in translation (DUF1610 family)
MADDDSTPYASCDRCGWHGRYEHLAHRAEGGYCCPQCGSVDAFGTADETREEVHRMRRTAQIGTIHALAERAALGTAEDAKRALEDILVITHLAKIA